MLNGSIVDRFVGMIEQQPSSSSTAGPIPQVEFDKRMRKVAKALDNLLAASKPTLGPKATKGQRKLMRKLQEEVQETVQTAAQADVAINGLQKVLADVKSAAK